MKRLLIATLFVAFLLGLPVSGEARETVNLGDATTQVAVGQTMSPLFLQIGRRRHRRMYRRAVVRRGRRIHRGRVIRRRRVIQRRR